jgi:multidrug efflux pump subunit AcrA (membrane-fusion protein)
MSKKKILIMVTVALIVSAGGYHYLQGGETERQVTVRQTATVERGLLVSSVSGTGQVQVSDSIDLKPGASSTVAAIGVKVGDTVKKGQILARLDASDVARAVRDAETNLASAKTKLDSLYDPPTELERLRQENSLINAEESLAGAHKDLDSAFESGFDQVTSVFLTLPSIMSDLDDILYGTDINSGQSNVDAYYDLSMIVGEDSILFKEDALEKYQLARQLYGDNF